MKSLLILALIIFMFLVIPSGFGEEAGFVYDPKGKHDPFVPVELAAKARAGIEGDIEDLSLEGILWDLYGDCFIIVNDENLKTGDEIMGFKIVEIKKGNVLLLKGERTYSISMETGR